MYIYILYIHSMCVYTIYTQYVCIYICIHHIWMHCNKSGWNSGMMGIASWGSYPASSPLYVSRQGLTNDRHFGEHHGRRAT